MANHQAGFSNVILDSLNADPHAARQRHNIEDNERRKRALAQAQGLDYDAEVRAEYMAAHGGRAQNPMGVFWNEWGNVVIMWVVTFFYFLIGGIFYCRMEHYGGDDTLPFWSTCKCHFLFYLTISNQRDLFSPNDDFVSFSLPFLLSPIYLNTLSHSHPNRLAFQSTPRTHTQLG